MNSASVLIIATSWELYVQFPCTGRRGEDIEWVPQIFICLSRQDNYSTYSCRVVTRARRQKEENIARPSLVTT